MPFNEFENKTQRIAQDLNAGNQRDASEMLRQEIAYRPNEAAALIQHVNQETSPNAVDRVTTAPDGSVILQNRYTGRAENLGHVNQGYGGQPFYGAQQAAFQQPYNTFSGQQQPYSQFANQYNPQLAPADRIARDLQVGNVQDAQQMIGWETRNRPYEARRVIERAAQETQYGGGRDRLFIAGNNVEIHDNMTGQNISAGWLPNSQIGNYYQRPGQFAGGGYEGNLTPPTTPYSNFSNSNYSTGYDGSSNYIPPTNYASNYNPVPSYYPPPSYYPQQQQYACSNGWRAGCTSSWRRQTTSSLGLNLRTRTSFALSKRAPETVPYLLCNLFSNLCSRLVHSTHLYID
jgi:hypothetical protein